MTAQNQRLVYWPMLKSGDFDMMPSQFDFYNRMLKKAELRFIHAFPKMEFSAYGKLSNKLRMREHTMNVFDRNIRRK